MAISSWHDQLIATIAQPSCPSPGHRLSISGASRRRQEAAKDAAARALKHPAKAAEGTIAYFSHTPLPPLDQYNRTGRQSEQYEGIKDAGRPTSLAALQMGAKEAAVVEEGFRHHELPRTPDGRDSPTPRRSSRRGLALDVDAELYADAPVVPEPALEHFALGREGDGSADLQWREPSLGSPAVQEFGEARRGRRGHPHPRLVRYIITAV